MTLSDWLIKITHKTWITEQNRIKPINSLNLGCEKWSFAGSESSGSHPSAILTRPDPLSLRRKVFMVGYFSEDIPEDNNEDWTSVSLSYANKTSLLIRRSLTSWWRHGTDIPEDPRSYFIQMTWFISEFIDEVNINLITWWLRPITWPEIQVHHFRLDIKWHAKQIHTGTTYNHPNIDLWV